MLTVWGEGQLLLESGREEEGLEVRTLIEGEGEGFVGGEKILGGGDGGVVVCYGVDEGG